MKLKQGAETGSELRNLIEADLTRAQCSVERLEATQHQRRRSQPKLTEWEWETSDQVMFCRLLQGSQIAIGAGYLLSPTPSSATRRSLLKLVRHHYPDTLPRRLPNKPAVYLLTRGAFNGLTVALEWWEGRSP